MASNPDIQTGLYSTFEIPDLNKYARVLNLLFQISRSTPNTDKLIVRVTRYQIGWGDGVPRPSGIAGGAEQSVYERASPSQWRC